MQSRKIWYYRITLIILLFAMLLAWALLPGVHEFINRSVAAFAAVDQQGIERFIQSYGALAAVVSVLVDDFAGHCCTATCVSDHLCKCVAVWRVLGRLAVVDQFDGRRGAVLFYRQSDGPRSGGKVNRQNAYSDSMDGFFTRYGKHTILVCRLLPFVPFDPVSYAAGLTSIRFRSFFIATGLGQLPATIVYSWAGSMLTGGTFWFVTGLFILFALTVVIFMAKKIWLERQKRNA